MRSYTRTALAVANWWLLAVTTTAQASPLEPFGPRSYPVDQNPRDTAIGDINGDGLPDIAVACYAFSNVSFVINTGVGVFENRPKISCGGENPIAIVAPDLNGDGDADVVTYNETSADLSVILSDGKGGFGAPTRIGIPPELAPPIFLPPTLVSADINGDGATDIVTGIDGEFATLINNGAGVLTTGPTIPYARQRAVSDLNNDGAPEIIQPDGAAGILILYNNGTGGFPSPVHVPIASATIDKAIAADLNNDTRPDLIGLDIANRAFFVLSNNGAGGFGPPAAFSLSDEFRQILSTDFTGQNGNDLIFTGRFGTALHTNNGVGGFSFFKHIEIDNGWESGAVAADFNNDGRGDFIGLGTGSFSAPFIVALMDLQNAVQNLIGIESFHPLPPQDEAAPSRGTNLNRLSRIVADLNNDGHLDFVYQSDVSPNIVDIVRSTCTSSYAMQSLEGVSLKHVYPAGDLDGDQDPDLLFAFISFPVALNHPDGFVIQETVQSGLDLEYSLVTADFDGDGDNDPMAFDTKSESFYLLIDTAAGQFEWSPITTPKFPSTSRFSHSRSVAGDLNGDNLPDLVIPGQSWTLILLNQGDLTFTHAPGSPWLHSFTQGSLMLADMDGDETLDLLFTDSANTHENAVHVYTNSGDGSLTFLAKRFVAKRPILVGIADFNGDSHLDIMTRANDYALLLNDGDGVPQKPIYLSFHNNRLPGWEIMDIDNNGFPDLIRLLHDPLTLEVLRNRHSASLGDIILNPPVFEDIDNNGAVDSGDIGGLLGAFGQPGPFADINQDGIVDTADLGLIIAKFGLSCEP